MVVQNCKSPTSFSLFKIMTMVHCISVESLKGRRVLSFVILNPSHAVFISRGCEGWLQMDTPYTKVTLNEVPKTESGI